MLNPINVETAASTKPASMKFGNLGGVDSIDAGVDAFATSHDQSDGEEAGWRGQNERRGAKSGVSKYARRFVGASPPNRNVALTGGALGAPVVDSIEVSHCKQRLPPAKEEPTPFDGDAEADLYIDWRKEFVNVAPYEGAHLNRAYPKTPEG